MISIRPASAADAALISSLIARAFARQQVAVEPPQSALRFSEGDVDAHFAAGGSGALAIMDNFPAGSVLWMPSADGFYLSRLAVDPAMRRNGAGLKLLEAAQGSARAAGASHITLRTRVGLTGNRALFAKAGFTETAFRAHEGFDHPTSVELEWRAVCLAPAHG